MIRTRFRKVLRDIWARKIRTLLVSTSIFIGVLGVVTLYSAGEILVTQLEKDLQQDRLAMIRINVTVPRGIEVDNSAVLATLRGLDKVTAVEGRAIYPLFWRKLDADPTAKFKEGYLVANAEPFDQAQLEPPRLLEGRFPTFELDDVTRGKIEIAIEKRLADENGLGIGDEMSLRVLSGTANTNGAVKTITGTIVGIVLQPYQYFAAAGPVDAATLVFMDYEEARYVGGFTGLNTILARFTDFPTAKENSPSFQAAIATQTPYIVTFTQEEDPAKNSSIESTRQTNNILVTLALIALIVSGFLIINVINSILVEQRRQIGLMKAIGATAWDNFLMYSGIALAYGIIGVIPGVLLGIVAANGAAQGLAAQSQTVLEGFKVSPSGIVVGVLAGVLIPFLASIIPVLNGTRVQILDAMTDFGIDARYGSGMVERFIGSLPFPLSIRQAVRNAWQKKFRLALTGATLTIAAGAFMGILATFSGLDDLVEENFDNIGAEIQIVPNEGQDFDVVKSALEATVPNLEAVEPASALAIEIEGYDLPPIAAGPPGVFAVGFNPANPNVLTFDLLNGDAWNTDPNRDGVVISSRIAEGLGLTSGDTITITGGGNQQAFTIIGVNNYPFDTVWMRWDTLSRFGGLTNANGEPYPNGLDVLLADEAPSADSVDKRIEQINEALLARGITADFTNWVALADLIATIVRIFGIILSLAAFLIALVGAVGLLTTLSISVFERQKEIGVMRSVGASSSTVALQFLAEGLIVGIVSWALSVPLSFLIKELLLNFLPFGDVFEVDYPPITLLIGLVGMIVIVTLASLLPSLSASRRTVSEILRYQ